MLISLFPTPFGHFQFLGSAGQNPNLILTLCRLQLNNIETKKLAGSQSSTINFAGETQTPSVGPVGLASAMFPATLTVAISNQPPAHQGCFSLPP